MLERPLNMRWVEASGSYATKTEGTVQHAKAPGDPSSGALLPDERAQYQGMLISSQLQSPLGALSCSHRDDDRTATSTVQRRI